MTSLQQAGDADFDDDGIPNFYEVEALGTNPFEKIAREVTVTLTG